MIEKPTTTLYEKVGRKYIPVAARWHEERDTEQMPVGTFRLIHAYSDGGKRYEYAVEPATAPMVAAMMIAKQAMEDAIREACKMRPSAPQPYTKKQQALIDKFRGDMGGMMPSWWTEQSSYEISDAAMKAVMEFRP